MVFEQEALRCLEAREKVAVKGCLLIPHANLTSPNSPDPNQVTFCVRRLRSRPTRLLQDYKPKPKPSTYVLPLTPRKPPMQVKRHTLRRSDGAAPQACRQRKALESLRAEEAQQRQRQRQEACSSDCWVW